MKVLKIAGMLAAIIGHLVISYFAGAKIGETIYEMLED